MERREFAGAVPAREPARGLHDSCRVHGNQAVWPRSENSKSQPEADVFFFLVPQIAGSYRGSNFYQRRESYLRV